MCIGTIRQFAKNIRLGSRRKELQSTRKPSNGELKVNMGNGVEVEVEYIGIAKLVLVSAQIFWI
jgi:hypothetical protein